MSRIFRFPDKGLVEQEAAAWLARLDGGELDRVDELRLRAWLSADSRNREAISRLAQVWGDMDCMTVLAELFPPDAPAESQHRGWAPTGALALVATILLVAGLYLGGVIEGVRAPPLVSPPQKMPSQVVYTTGRGEQSEIQLRDGSMVTLNTDSEARIQFDDHARSVYLTRGEAHFKVAKNPNLPFEVHAGPGIVRAVGTAFNVRVEPDQVEVLVDEGVVEVVPTATPGSNHPAASPRALRVKKGDAAGYGGDAAWSETLPAMQIEKRLAWRKGKWMFEGETLAEVLEEVARYSDRKIVITDPAIGQLRVGGYFDIGDVDGLLSALEAGLGIAVVRTGEGYRLEASGNNGA